MKNNNFVFTKIELSGAYLIEPHIFKDERGFFAEMYNESVFKHNGIEDVFVQDNFSYSKKGVIRGLHFQTEPHNTAKLLRCVRGEICDVIVDLRKSSPTFGKWKAFILSDKNMNIVYVPKGFAHGFCVTSEEADVHYKVTDYYYSDLSKGLRWDDPDLNIKWPINNPVILSDNDSNWPSFKESKYQFFD